MSLKKPDQLSLSKDWAEPQTERERSDALDSIINILNQAHNEKWGTMINLPFKGI